MKLIRIRRRPGASQAIVRPHQLPTRRSSTERSGKKSWVHWRFASSKFIRQTFVEWAAESTAKSFWAKLFYEQHRAKGASRNATLRALAFKWIRILFRCWVDRRPYDESRYLSALQKRQAPLLQFAATSPS